MFNVIKRKQNKFNQKFLLIVFQKIIFQKKKRLAPFFLKEREE